MINTDLEKVIRENTASFGLVGSEFVVRVQHDLGDEGLVFYIRPQDRDGQTVEFIVKGNDLETKEGVYRPTHTSLYLTNVRLSEQLQEWKSKAEFYSKQLTEIRKVLTTTLNKEQNPDECNPTKAK